MQKSYNKIFEQAEHVVKPTLKFPRGRISARGDVASKDLHTVLLSRHQTDVVSLR